MIYPAVMRCIYCGATPPKITLSDEHIIPYSLGGKLVLKESSCGECARITSKFEGEITRYEAKAFRAIFNIQSRKKFSGKFPIAESDGQSLKFSTTDLNSHHCTISLPCFPPPGSLRGLPRGSVENASWSPWHFPPVKFAQERFEKIGRKTVTLGLPLAASRRLAAKIGFSYAVALLGKSFHPIIVDYILGNSDENEGMWLVGGEINSPLPTNNLHEISLEKHDIAQTRFLVARVRLFSNLGGPIYRAVIGTLI